MDEIALAGKVAALDFLVGLLLTDYLCRLPIDERRSEAQRLIEGSKDTSQFVGVTKDLAGAVLVGDLIEHLQADVRRLVGLALAKSLGGTVSPQN